MTLRPVRSPLLAVRSGGAPSPPRSLYPWCPMVRTLALLLLVVAGCQKAPPEPAPEAAEVDGAADEAEAPDVVVESDEEPEAADGVEVITSGEALAAASGQRVTLEGEVVRATPEGGEEGTAIRLSDGTDVYVAFGEPPHGWDWLIGTEVRVQGTLQTEPEGVSVPMLLDPDAPMPAGMGGAEMLK